MHLYLDFLLVRPGDRIPLDGIVEEGETSRIFTNPTHKQTEDYITGRFG